MTTIRQYTCTKCGKKYVYYPSYSGSKPKNWGKSTKELCPECKEKEESHEPT
jgi:DNA-directed RNA polymerase subunit RPC12/RpoP